MPAARVIVTALVVAVVVNLAIFLLGALAGGTYEFTSPAGPATVNAAVVAMFTLIPLALCHLALVPVTVLALRALRTRPDGGQPGQRGQRRRPAAEAGAADR
jgi:hypothetical protein